jgi:hypothetical protein
MEKERATMSHLRQAAKCIRIFSHVPGYGLFKSSPVTYNKRTVGHVAHSMQRTSNLFLSRSGLAAYQHRSKVWADPLHLQPQPLDLRAGAHDLETVALGPRLFDKSARRFKEGRRIRSRDRHGCFLHRQNPVSVQQ